MSGRDLFERILVALHESTFDDGRWSEVSWLIDEACGSKGNMLVFGDDSSRRTGVLFARFCYRGQRREDFEREYYRDVYPVDDLLPRLRLLPDSLIVGVDDLRSDGPVWTSPLLRDAAARAEIENALRVRMDGPGRSRIFLTLADPVDAAGWTSARTGMLTRILPHVRHYLRARQALADARAVGATFADLLDEASLGVIELDRGGGVVGANDRARALLRKGDGLRDIDGALRAARPDQDDALQKLVARALPVLGGTRTGGSMRLSRDGRVPPLVLHVNPLRGETSASCQGRSGALVLVVDPVWRTGLDPQRVGELLGLTPAESRVAVLYAQGGTIDGIAAATGRSRTTVKWHIRHIYAKHSISRQVELAQLVMPLAGVAQIRP